MAEPSTLDTSPLSEFVTKMRDVFRRRLAAVNPRDARAIEAEMVTLMRTYLGRDAWDVALPAEPAAPTPVPRATRRRAHVGHQPSRYAGDSFDHKLAAAGERNDE